MNLKKDAQTVDQAELTLIEAIGEHEFLEALTRALTTDQKADVYHFIARTFDVDAAREMLEAE